MLLSSFILLERQRSALLKEGDFTNTVDRLLYFFTEEITVPLKEKVLENLNFTEAPGWMENALSSSASDVGMVDE